MEENTGVGLRVAAGIFLTILLITIVVMITISSQDAAKQGQTKIASITTQLSDTEFNTYNNTTLSGSQVLNAIRQYLTNEQFGVLVTTGKGGSTYYGDAFAQDGTITSTTKNTILTNAENQASNDYINPSGKFRSVVIRDANSMIRGIEFKQQ